ncbi:MAG: zinc finger domain-containing protein [Thermoplasmatota archaeon]
MREGRCVSCGRGLVERGSVTFPCPECSATINRCSACRERAATYECPECGFRGP